MSITSRARNGAEMQAELAALRRPVQRGAPHRAEALAKANRSGIAARVLLATDQTAKESQGQDANRT